MLQLYILRHFKTGWALPGQKDFDRQLTDRGISDRQIICNYLSKSNTELDTVYCSPATRTKQSLEGILPAFKQPPHIEYCEEFYSGFVDEYLNRITSHKNNKPLMIVGHNPTCASLASMLAGSGDEVALATLAFKYPTGGLCVLEFDFERWSEITKASGLLKEFILPKSQKKQASA